MKKSLLVGLLAFAGLSANAQQFPAFSGNDVTTQVEHNVQTYLAQGKTVVLDISATWCAPCWSFHNSHALEKLYYAYGPEGSDELVVIFVEGDFRTPLENLYGTGTSTGYNPPRPPQGNWVEGVPYPIINDDNLGADLNLTAFPSLYRVCSDGTYAQIPNNQMGSMTSIINRINQCGTLVGVTNHALVHDKSFRLCDDTGTAAASVSFTNYGTNAITAATLTIKDSEGTVVATTTYAGNLAMFGSATVAFDDANYVMGEDYTVEIADINSTTPFSQSIGDITISAIAGESYNNIEVRAYTDNYPGEISWKIRNSEGTVVAQAGPYQAGPGAAGAGGPDANTTKTHLFTIPGGIDCLSVELIDEYGDGWSLGNTPHGIEVFNQIEGSSVYKQLVGNFGESIVTESAFRTNGTLGNEAFTANSAFAMYPNPTNGILNFTTEETVNVTIVDIQGKTVFTASNINNGDTINLSTLQTGMYIAKINGETTKRVEKIMIK